MIGPRELLDVLQPAHDAGFPVLLRLRKEPLDSGGDGFHAFRIEGDRHIRRNLPKRAVAGAGARHTPRHRLDERKPKALEETRKHIEPRLAPKSLDVFDESRKADEIGVWRLRRRLMHHLGVFPVRPRDHERMRFRQRARQPPVGLDEPQMVLARMFDAGDVEKRSAGGRDISDRRDGRDSPRIPIIPFIPLIPSIPFIVSLQPVVENCYGGFAAVPILHHVGLGCTAHGDKMLRPLRKERQHVREIEHPQPRILAGDVEVGKVVHRRRGRQRIPCADTSVCRTYHEAVEVAPVPPDPERQHKDVPQHRECRAARPARSWNHIRHSAAGRRTANVDSLPRLHQQRKLMPLARQFSHNLAHVNGNAAFASIIRDAGDKDSHDATMSPNRALSFAPVTGLEMILANRLMS